MITTFIAALTALFFWNKSTKDVEEKTQLSSWTRTIVYGVLMIAVWVFYIKTYQVATVFHTIQVRGLRETINSDGEIADTIATIELTNKFSSGITENVPLNHIKSSNIKLRNVAETGGVFGVINLHNGNKYNIRTNPLLEDQYKGINQYTPPIKIKDYPIESFSHVYEISYFNSRIPSLIPFFPTFVLEKEAPVETMTPFSWFRISDFDSFGPGVTYSTQIQDHKGVLHKVKEDNIHHEMYVGAAVLSDTITCMEDYHFKFDFSNNFSNRLTFFTAADISQYTCDIRIETDCYVKNLWVSYDLPIEINSYDSCMSVSAYSFKVDGDFLNKKIVNKGAYRFHVKLPTLANLQLIRSLILTTLLTALVSLFFLNLFYRLRKHFIDFKERHIEEIAENRLKPFKFKLYVLLYTFLIIIAYVSWRIYKDRPFHIKLETFEWLYEYNVLILLGFVLLLSVLIYFLFRKAYVRKIKKDATGTGK